MENNVYIVYDAHYDYYEWLNVVIVGESRELIETWWNNQPESVRGHKFLEFDSPERDQLKRTETQYYVMEKKELLTNSPN